MTLVTLEVETRKKLPTVLLSRKLTEEQRDGLQFSLDSSGAKPRLIGSDQANEDVPMEGNLITSNPVKYAIGFRESGADKMKIFEVDMFSVDPGLKRPAVSDELLAGGSYYEQRQTLIDSYAPAKKRRQVKLAINAQVKDEKIHAFDESMRDLRTKLKETPVSETSGVLAQMTSILPPFDVEATEPAHVFDFTLIFTDEFLASFDPSEEGSAAEQMTQWIKDGCRSIGAEHPLEPILSLRTINRLANIFIESVHMKKKSFARMLLVAGVLVLMYSQRQDKTRSADSLCIPEDAKRALDRLYGWGRLNQENSDKLLCHLCLWLARLTPDWRFPFQLLIEDIKGINPRDLSGVLEFCGFKLSSGLNAALVAPLKVAEIRKRKGGK